ncbi:MAG: cytochrome c oxidase assembly protein, partial [Rickettsiales bacterium]|nr:cytochrome c oxidase assembly protein [Rickettsiales bacterium]
VNRDMPWDFEAVQREVSVRTGENKLIFYHAKNTTNDPIKGVATFNVTPDKAATYFSKVSCFCFEEQTLEASQEVEMPVSFFIDPEFENDSEMDDVKVITLSYTFFNADE